MMYQLQQEAVGFDEETAKHSAKMSYASDVSIQAFAKSEGFEVIVDQQEQATSTYLNSLVDEVRIPLEDLLQKKGYSMKDYEQFVQEHLSTTSSLKKQLLKTYKETYAGFDENVLRSLLEAEAYYYYETTHPKQLAKLNKEFHYVISPSSGDTLYGVIVEIADGAILFAPGFIGEFRDEDRQGLEDESDRLIWFPKLEGWDVALGDAVKINMLSSYWTSEDENLYNHAGVGINLEIIQDEVIQFKLSSNQTMQTIDWSAQEVEFMTAPAYRFHVGEESYNAWLTPDTQWLELYEPKKKQYAKVRIEKFSMWMSVMSP